MSTLADYYENLELAELEGVSFGLYTSSEIKKNSVLRVSVPLSFDQLGHPVPGGLYDRALGPVSESDKCVTCGYSQAICPGHIGHIELPVPVVHPLFHMTVFLLLKLSCRSCYSIIIHENFKNLLSTQMKLLELGLITEAANAERDLCNALSLISNSHDLLKAEPFFVKEQLYIYLQKCINANEENEIGLFKENRNIEQLRSVCVTSVLKQVPVSKKCLVCKAQFIPIKRLGGQIVTSVTRAEATPNPADKEAPPVLVKMKKVGDSVMMPQKIRDHLRKVWVKDKEFLTCLYPILGNCCLEHSTDLFFMDTVVVTPPCSRPVQFKDGQIVEPAYNSTYKNIIQDSMILLNLAYMVNSGGDTENLSKELKDVIEHTKGSTSLEKLHQTWLELQSNVDHLLDKDLNKTTSGATAIGVKQILEKKEGLFRMKMMGKRVNYCCRTVITPDPNLDVDEVGIPKAFAMKLSYPVPVTPWNIEELRRMIINGPAIHPGANLVLDDHGCIIRLKPDDIKQRRVVAKRLLTPSGNQPNERLKVVFRHLCNGDIMLLNRQPTLHRPSIMGHRARVLDTDKTFRMHYANCKSYNADFDGDEMNAHFPQNELARSEGYHLAAVSHHYLVPKDGTPLSGLIQDHVISGVKLSVRGRFFNRSDYQHLVFQALTRKSGYIQLLPPAIWKPVPLWSGKQIISTVIINVIPAGKSRINLCSTAKINSKDWEMNKPRVWLAGGGPLKSHIEMSEAEVIIREGELLNGVLDKTHYGATPYGLVHCMNELYGGPSSLLLLSCFSKLFGAFLQMDGFTLGVKDILVQKKAERRRTKVIENISKSGHKIALEALGYSEADKETIKNEFEAAFHNDPVKWQKHLDMYYKDTLDTFTNEINKICIPGGLFSKFPDNNLQLMIKSGAKGSAVNAMQISCLLGQIELEGKRPPVMKSGKSLPSFAAFDTSPRAGGFIDNRFMTGLKPQEFFFHCMAGREGLIDTAVKTSRSGYLQRCLVKHLEGLSVKYDLTVRDSDDGLVQFYYGEDGMDLAKSKFMNEKYFQFLVDNRKVIFSKKVISKVRNPFVLDQINDDQEQIMKWRTKFGSEEKKRRISPFQTLRFGKKFPLSKEDKEIDHTTGRPKGIHLWIERFRNANHRDRKRAMDVTRCPDPVNSKFRIDSVYGSISENMEEIMNSYIKKVSNNVSSSSKWAENIRKMVYLKSMTSICPPGEPVGLLAAQSIGEPSTQMTLNTFHFAGRGEMNVTLGIPRLREILMFASKNIKTPSMEIPFISSIPKLKKQSETLKRKFARVTLADVLEDVIVKEYYETTPPRCTCYDIRMTFLPRSEYKKQFSVKPSVILKAVEKRYVSMLLTTLSKAASTKSISMFFDKKKSGSTGSKRTGDDEDICQPVEEPVHVPNINESESSEDEPEADEDATSARNRLRRDESQEYEEPEEEVAEEMVQVFKEESEEDVDETAVVPSEDIESSFLSMLEGERYEETNDNNTNDNNANKNVTNKEEVMDDEIQNCVTDEWAHMRRNLVVSKSTLVKNYVFDVKEEMWCEISFKFPVNYKRIDLVSIIKETASKCVVQEVPGIKKAIIYKEPLSPDTLMFKTDGINLLEIFNCDRILNLNKLYSNDINAVATTYGIEAACRVIVKEITNVFKVYGIVVDPRHLILVADYMTRDGEFRPMSRKGLEDSISPFQKMTFESSVAFLKAATLNGRLDLLESPSSCISLGVPIKMGTGLPEIMHSF